MNNATVAKYYDTHQFYYSNFWSPTALHYGLWYPDTRSLTEAIINTNVLIAESLSVNKHDSVLDAGCGVGGTSIFLAEKSGAKVHGITLSAKQLAIANALTRKSPAAQLLKFSQMDYCHAPFQDSTFTKLVAIESVCHADNKLAFLQEAFRLLSPGGQIAVVDFFFAQAAINRDERDIHERLMAGWAVSNLATVTEFGSFMTEAGFAAIEYRDLREYIWPSVERIYRYGLLAWPINFVKSRLGLAPKSVACRYQRSLFREGVGTYGMFMAKKPLREPGD